MLNHLQHSSDCSERVTGEDWLAEKPGAYLRGVWEEVCEGILSEGSVDLLTLFFLCPYYSGMHAYRYSSTIFVPENHEN